MLRQRQVFDNKEYKEKGEAEYYYMLCDIEIITHPKYPRNILLKQKIFNFSWR